VVPLLGHFFYRACVFRILFSVLLLCIGVRAFGQAQNSGQVAGNVADARQLGIPGAAITLRSEERGNELTGKSDAQGQYVFNDVPQGSYTLTVVAPAFEKYVVTHVMVDADSHLRLDATLNIGSVTQQVEVTAGTKSVDTQSATISMVIDNNLVENLPIDGNNVVALAALLPGVTDVSAPTTFTSDTGGPSFAVNGARSSSNLFLFDGLNWNNLFMNTGLNYPNHAALQSVSVQLNNYTAQYGRNAGSILNVLSKSGTDLIHGEAFLFYQTGVVDASDFFTGVKPNISQYQFGASVGGPIIREKLFYEAEFQTLLSHGTAVSNAPTLSYAERGLEPDGVTPRPCDQNGSFAGFAQCASFAGDATSAAVASKVLENPVWTGANATGNAADAISEFNSTWLAQGNSGPSPCVTALQNAYTPAAGTPTTRAGFFPDPEIPSVCFDPTFQNILKHSNLPNPTLNTGSQYLGGVSVVPQPKHEYGGNLRIDWNARPSQIIDFHYYQTYNNDATTNGAGGTTGVQSYEPDFNIANIHAGSVGHTWVLGPNLLNVARLGYKRYVYIVSPLDPTTLANLGSDFSSPTVSQLPIITVSTRFNLGSTAGIYTNNVNEDIEGVDTVSYTHGAHNIEAGLNYVRAQYQGFTSNPGQFTFNNQYANDQSAEAMMGLLYQEQVGNNRKLAAVQHALYTYLQDTWRASPKLTIIAGVRYELPWNWYQPKGYSETFIRDYQSIRFPNAPANLAFVGDPGVRRSLYPTSYNNVSPRIGLSYDLFGNGKTAIRAGFGSFYDATPALVVGIGEPYYYSANYVLPPGSLTNPLYQEPAIPQNYVPGTPATFTSPQSIIFPDPRFQNSYTWGFNLGVQHQLNRGSTIEVNYIGRLSRHLTMPIDLNPAIRDCSGIYYATNPSLYCYGGPVASNNPIADPMSATQTSQIQCTQKPISSVSTTSNLCPSFNVGYTARVVYPNFNYGGQGVVDYTAEGTANYHALQLIYVQRAFRNLTMLASYTFSKSLDMQSNISSTNATPQNINLQYGLSDLNAAQIYNMGFRLQLPNVNAKTWVQNIANNWNFNGLYSVRSGHPMNIIFSGDVSSFDEPQDRPFLIPGQLQTLPSSRHRSQKIAEWFNTAAFVKPNLGTFGNVGRNTVTGPAYINTSFSLTKEIVLARLREGMRAQFRVEVFDPFNTVNLANPGVILSTSSNVSSTFGVVQADNSGNRRMQFGFLFYF
jgi:hypothetical protein